MHKYVIKNIEDFTIVLKTTDGQEITMNPGSYIQYQTKQDNLHPVLTHLFKKGNIDYWRFEIPEIEDFGKVDWQKEGF